MQKLKINDELDILNNIELLAYRKDLKKYAKYLSTRIEDLKESFYQTEKLLKDRLIDLQYDALEAEEDRLNSDTYMGMSLLEIN